MPKRITDLFFTFLLTTVKFYVRIINVSAICCQFLAFFPIIRGEIWNSILRHSRLLKRQNAFSKIE